MIAFIAGALLGGIVGAWLAWTLFQLRGPRRIEITIDRELLGHIASKTVAEWLDDKGLTWMPKGLPEIMVRQKAEKQRGADAAGS